MFDYGAPTGFRLAAAHPERVTAIISQNGNAYQEGLSNAWAPYQAYWKSGSAEARNACRAALTPEAIRTQYLTGADPHRMSPDGYTLDAAYFQRPGTDEIQLDPGGRGTRPIIARLLTGLPEPDSPIIANVSPSRTSKLTPSTASASPSSVVNRTANPARSAVKN